MTLVELVETQSSSGLTLSVKRRTSVSSRRETMVEMRGASATRPDLPLGFEHFLDRLCEPGQFCAPFVFSGIG